MTFMQNPSLKSDSSKNRIRDAAPQARENWTERIIDATAVGQLDPVEWMVHAYDSYRAKLSDYTYPCFFGQTAEQHGEVFYAFTDERLEALRNVMHTFVRKVAEPRYSRHSLALFFKPNAALRTHHDFVERFWSVLTAIRSEDTVSMEPADPDHPLWEFAFEGQKMFVVGTSPTYEKRRSRVLGDGMVLLFQPRQLFADPATGQPISREVRRRIHGRMLTYDGMSVHPDIGFYGEETNREWKQYVLPDDNEPSLGGCPFLSKFSP